MRSRCPLRIMAVRLRISSCFFTWQAFTHSLRKFIRDFLYTLSVNWKLPGFDRSSSLKSFDAMSRIAGCVYDCHHLPWKEVLRPLHLHHETMARHHSKSENEKILSTKTLWLTSAAC